jgi:hypothetical protein
MYPHPTVLLAVLGVLLYVKEPVLTCDSTRLEGPLVLLVSDLHVHPYMPLWNWRMRKVVQQVRRTHTVAKTVMLGDAMHWAGGLTFHDRNLSDTDWDTAVQSVRWIIGPDAIAVPGNHDLNGTTTNRWNEAFGPYNRYTRLFPNVTARLASSMAPREHHAEVVLSHYPIYTTNDTLWHPGLRLALNGHMHAYDRWTLDQATQITLPTLNPFQAATNNGTFSGSGQQGFGLLDAQLRLRVCMVTMF